MRPVALVAIGLVAVGLLGVAGRLLLAPRPDVEEAPVGDDRLEADLALYREHCGACHGSRGLGDGPVAARLDPRPRDFSRGQFRLISTDRGPTDADLERTIRRGMPGSAMPPWGHLPDEEIHGLVRAVRHLALEGRIDSLVARGLEPDEARTLAGERLAPGQPISIGPEPECRRRDPVHGKHVFVAAGCADCHRMDACAGCHIEEGYSVERRDLVDSQGRPTIARDYALGVFKGGGTRAELALRIRTGLPGTPMPAHPKLSEEDLWALLDFIQSLGPLDKPVLTLAERGWVLYNESGCGTCHGIGAVGGVPNPNAASGVVPELRRLAFRMGLEEPEERRRAVETLERPGRRDRFDDPTLAASYDRVRSTILDGATAERADPAADRPPLAMPPWRSRLGEEDVDAILAYLIDLADEEGR